MAQPAKAKATALQTGIESPLPGAPFERIPGEEPPLMLALDDLVRDQAGEVVLFNDSGLRALALSATTIVV